MSEDRLIMPVVAIRGITMLPGMMIHFDIHKESKRMPAKNEIRNLQHRLRMSQIYTSSWHNALLRYPCLML